MRKLFGVLLIPVFCLLLLGVAFAEDNEATVSLDSPSSSQSYAPGDNVQISGKTNNITEVTISVQNPKGSPSVYNAQQIVTNNTFSTEFQLNDNAEEGQYTIKIGAKELVDPVSFTFKVSNSSNDSNTSSGGGGGGTTSQAVTSTTGKANVKPGAGGTISLGSEATVQVPVNALLGTNTVEIKVQKATTTPAVPSGFRLAGTVYEFSVGGKNSYTFAKDVTITLSFDPNNIGAEETPAIEYYDEALSQWINLGGTVSGNTVTIQVNHFTKFVVMAVKNAEEQKTEEQKTLTLKDITGHWAFDNINKLVGLNCISGYPDGSFKPDNTITRAEFATALVKAFKLKNNGSIKNFDDTTDHWAKDYIATAATNGIVNGYESNTFGPNDLITREQMAVMIVKAAKLAPVAGENQFDDSDSISDWAKEAVATATGSGIMKGYPDNTVRPLGSATRAEAVTVIVNALNN